MFPGQRVKVKTWLAIKDGVIVKVFKKHVVVTINGIPTKFWIKTMLEDTTQKHPMILILDLKLWERDQRARDEWDNLQYPGLEKFEQIKILIGKKLWQKLL